MESRYTQEQLDEILEEVSGFEVQLEEDPTLPSLGNLYINERLSQCRSYTNRIVYYMQKLQIQIRAVKRELLLAQTDYDMKFSDLLANDESVKQRSSFEDRKALAMTYLHDELSMISELKQNMESFEDVYKIIKMQHQNLVRTNSDIKTQRQIIKEDKQTFMYDGQGSDPRMADGNVSTPVRNDGGSIEEIFGYQVSIVEEKDEGDNDEEEVKLPTTAFDKL